MLKSIEELRKLSQVKTTLKKMLIIKLQFCLRYTKRPLTSYLMSWRVSKLRESE